MTLPVSSSYARRRVCQPGVLAKAGVGGKKKPDYLEAWGRSNIPPGPGTTTNVGRKEKVSSMFMVSCGEAMRHSRWDYFPGDVAPNHRKTQKGVWLIHVYHEPSDKYAQFRNLGGTASNLRVASSSPVRTKSADW